MNPIPDYGDHMTMEEFREYVVGGGFNDMDGHAHYATATEMWSGWEAETYVDLSAVARGTTDPKWTHVVWFNK